MAFADTQLVSTTTSNVLSVLARPFVAFGNFMVRLAESSSQAQALAKLADLSDADLAAKGTSRSAQINEILRGYMHV